MSPNSLDGFDVIRNITACLGHIVEDFIFDDSGDTFRHPPMQDKKDALTSTWKSTKKDLKELQSQLKNLQEYLGTGGAESMQSHVHEENHEEEQKQPEQSQEQTQKKGQSSCPYIPSYINTNSLHAFLRLLGAFASPITTTLFPIALSLLIISK